MPPAAYWAAQGQLNFWGVVAAGTLGGYVGSTLSYALCYWLGDRWLIRYGKYFFIKEDNIHLVETIVQKYGAWGVFLARFLPVVRHLISLPAGIFRLRFAKFSIATATGAGIWCYVLSFWGEKIIGRHTELLNSPEDLMQVIRSEMSWFIFGAFSLALLYTLVIWLKRRSA